MPSPSQLALRAKRRANGAEAIAARHAELSHPGSPRNVRIYQGVMAQAIKDRSTILRFYLDRRKKRTAK